MPRFLVVWITVSLAVVWAFVVIVGGSFGLSSLTHAGEAPFTREQMAYLHETFPSGVYISASQYRWCDGRIWVYFSSRGDTWNFAQQCWKP